MEMSKLSDLNYDAMFQVIDSWERLRRVDDFEKYAGTILFQRLFTKCPNIKALFGFPVSMDPKSETLLKSKRFLTHATYMIQMLDKALSMLGPDVELLAEILADLGKKHARYGVKEEYFFFMGEALHETLKETLGSNFTDEDKEAWHLVYDALSEEMCKSMNKDIVVLKSWEDVKKIKNYKEVAGSVLFKSFFTKCPESKTFFGFPSDMDPKSDSLLNSRRFKMHASYFIEMLDTALKMVSQHHLEDNIKRLGEIHAEYRVKEEFFPVMGEALMEALKETLQKAWTRELESAWVEVYKKLSSEIIRAMKVAKIVN